MTQQLPSKHLVTKIESSGAAFGDPFPALSFSAGPLDPAPAVRAPGVSCRTQSRDVRSHRHSPHLWPETPGELESKHIALPLVLGEDAFQDALFEIS